MIAGRSRITGSLKVRDEIWRAQTGTVRDIVILMRSAARWNEEFKEVLAREGIPAMRVRDRLFCGTGDPIVTNWRTLDNPPDIPLYGVLRGFFTDLPRMIADPAYEARRTSMISPLCCGGICRRQTGI